MGHGGGDTRMVDYFYDMIINNKELKETSLSGSIQSHEMAFAAEKSRLENGKLIEFNK